jgi:hypothetical protein
MEKKPGPKPKRQALPRLGKPAAGVDGEAPRLHEAILDEEIAALRASARKMLAHADEVEEPLDAIKAFSAFGAQVVRIANLLRLQAALNANSNVDEIAATIRSVIDEAAKEWNL